MEIEKIKCILANERKKPGKTVSIYMSADLITALDHLCKETKYSKSKVISAILEHSLLSESADSNSQVIKLSDILNSEEEHYLSQIAAQNNITLNTLIGQLLKNSLTLNDKLSTIHEHLEQTKLNLVCIDNDLMNLQIPPK